MSLPICLLALLLFQTTAPDPAYVVVRVDGTRIELAGPPRLKGGRYVATLRGSGQLVSFPAGEVDEERTAAANRPAAGSAPAPTQGPAVAPRREPAARSALGDRARLTVPREKAEAVLRSASGTAKPTPVTVAEDEGVEDRASAGDKPEGAEIPDHVDRRGRGEAYWRGKADRLRRTLANAEADLRLAQAEAGRWEREVPAFDAAAQATWARELARMRGNVDRARVRVERARKELEDLSDEARRADAYPGWIR